MGRRSGESRRSGKRLYAGRQCLGAARMNGASAALVTCVEGREQVDHLGATHFSDHQPVGPHPEGLTYQATHGHLARALDVGRACLQPDHVVVAGRSSLRSPPAPAVQLAHSSRAGSTTGSSFRNPCPR